MYSESKPSHCHFVHHKFHMAWKGVELGLPRWQAFRVLSKKMERLSRIVMRYCLLFLQFL